MHHAHKVVGNVWEQDVSFIVRSDSCLKISPLSSIQTKSLEYKVKKIIPILVNKPFLNSSFVRFSTELVGGYFHTRLVVLVPTSLVEIA